MKLVNASLVFIAIFIFLGIWKYATLDAALVPTLGALMAVYLVISLKNRHASIDKKDAGLVNSIIPIFLLIVVVGILVISNGGLLSPLFFLFTFICFAITFVLPPQSVFVFTAGIVLLFLPDGASEDMMANIVHFGSLILLTPIAYFFGRELQARARKNAADQETADRIRREAATVLRDNQNMSEDNKVQLADIIHETDTLRKE